MVMTSVDIFFPRENGERVTRGVSKKGCNRQCVVFKRDLRLEKLLIHSPESKKARNKH